MSAGRSIRKSVPYASSPSSDSMFYNYSPNIPLAMHPNTTRSSLAEETRFRSPDFVWEAEYQDKMTVLKKSISQVPSTEKRQINFQFIDDMKATFDFKSLHSKRKRPTVKQITADNKAAARKDRKGAVKLPVDVNKKRRPRNAFILYRTVLQAKAEFKGKTQTELSRLIAACWQNEPPETRARFERAAELEKTFGYGATDVFNIKVGPADKEWDSEDVDHDSRTQNVSEMDDVNSPFGNPDPEYGQPSVHYPMYVTPFSPPEDQNQQDFYQVQASFQMLGSPYTDSPVYAGTPCGQINISPQQSMFPFTTFPMESSADQNTPMSPQDYGRSPAYFPPPMEHSNSAMTAGDSFALQMSPPEVSDIPADYSTFENYPVDYNSTATNNTTVNEGYSNQTNQNTYQYQNGNNEMFTQGYHASHHSLGNANANANETDMYMPSQYPVNNQTDTLEGFIDQNDLIFGENPDCYNDHPGHYQ